MTVTLGTVENFRSKRSWVVEAVGGGRRRKRVADGGRNEGELQQGQGTHSTGRLFFIGIGLAFHFQPSSSSSSSFPLSLLFPQATLITPLRWHHPLLRIPETVLVPLPST